MKPILYPKHSQSGFDNWSTLRSYVHLLLLAYAWFWTCVRWHLTLVFSVLFFKSFQNFFWNIFLGLRRGFSFESNFNISFCRISNLSFYLVRTGFGKVVRKITRWKVWCVTCTFWYFPRISSTQTFWLTYGNFMVIVELCQWVKFVRNLKKGYWIIFVTLFHCLFLSTLSCFNFLKKAISFYPPGNWT